MNDYPKLGFFQSNLFIFLVGEVATILCAVVFFAVGWGKLSQQFVENYEWRKYVDAKIERMDKEGTNASRYGIQSEKVELDQHETRLKIVEDETRKTDVIAEKISRIEESLREIKNSVKK